MYIPDLTELLGVNPYSFRDPRYYKNKYLRWHYDPKHFGAKKVIAVGWLGNCVETKGTIPDKCIDSLFKAYSEDQIHSDMSCGWHNCEICSGKEQWYQEGKVGPQIKWRGRELYLYGHGHYLVRRRDTVYMCPALILHYILDHDYQPPKEFIDAVTNGEFIPKKERDYSELKQLRWRIRLLWYRMFGLK